MAILATQLLAFITEKSRTSCLINGLGLGMVLKKEILQAFWEKSTLTEIDEEINLLVEIGLIKWAMFGRELVFWRVK